MTWQNCMPKASKQSTLCQSIAGPSMTPSQVQLSIMANLVTVAVVHAVLHTQSAYDAA